MASSDQAFIDLCLHYLKDDYPGRIVDCLARLSKSELNWRPNDRSNSISNLVCHLVGNCSQWVYQGLGNFEFERKRDLEFDVKADYSETELKMLIAKCQENTQAALSLLDSKSLNEKITIQGFGVTRREALFHATEHFSMHTGQIIYITKLVKGVSLDFYSITKAGARPRWKESGV